MPATIFTVADNLEVDLMKLKGITVIVTVPAAFSGTCTNICIPEIVNAAPDMKKAGADLIVVVSCDQPDAIRKWVESARWNYESNLAFASDFGKFEMRSIVGKLSDEEGKKDLPASLGELIRRSYSIMKDGKIVWQFIEPNSSKYSLEMEQLTDAIQAAAKS